MSSSSGLQSQAHPIAGFAVRVNQVLDGLAGVPVWSMTAVEQRSAVVELARAEARLVELRLRVLAAADTSGVAADCAAPSTAAWVASATRQVRGGAGGAHADLVLARALDSTCEVTRAGLAAGSVNLDQARVIVRAVRDLPESVCMEDRVRAEAHLVGLAGVLDAKALRVAGRRVFEVLDPAAADAEEGRRLEAEEATAARATYLHLFDNGDGTHTGRFKIPTLHAVMLTKILDGFTNPRHVAGQPDRMVGRSRPGLRGAGFCRFLERVPAKSLPRAGGVNAQVVVLLDYDTLLTGLGAASLDTGERISAGQARRLACEAGVIPAVYAHGLGGPSQVLDLDRRRRLHNTPQRVAMTVRDRGCTATGCERPAGWCHAHHQTPWSRGGATSVENGRLLCGFHHGRAHSPSYATTTHPDGKVSFHRRE